MEATTKERHTIQQSLLLHLLPGLLIGSFYFLVRQPIQNRGFPAIFSLMLAIACVLIPVEMGYLFYQGRRITGRYTLAGVISYRQAIPWWQYLVWVTLVFIATGAIFTILKPVEQWLQLNLFAWLPEVESGLTTGYSRTVLIITYASVFVFGAILGPLAEELYFRGYLLPRMRGKFAPVAHSFLFAVYHIFTPWMILTRTLGLLPLVYAVRKKNIYIGIIVHMLVNTLDVIAGVAFIANIH